ncbi:MAG: bifunctional ADP-heptose synthase [Bacteroidales bacterium]|jgi:rfaE bifunctional protein kinase chain/domain|nr:bifunctional ADP-heptose synthase [Bacteroidales bacterium]
MTNTQKYTQLFKQFSSLKVLIIGDVIIDAYLWGNVERISPEAPVPIVNVNSRANRLGGAANVALNIKALGAEPIICSVIGNDNQANTFLDLLAEANISSVGMVKSKNRVTSTKFRVIGNNAQMLRVDEEMDDELILEDEILLYDRIKQIIKENKIDVIIFQDYDKGVITKSVFEKTHKVIDGKIPIAVDPKRKNFFLYKNVDLFKPNLKELQEATNNHFDKKDIKSLKQEVVKLQKQLNTKLLLTTLSDQGVFISENSAGKYSSELLPAHLRSISDVSGAGDTVISVAALCLALNTDKKILAELSNLAGGLVCEELGVIPVNKEKLLNETIKIYG